MTWLAGAVLPLAAAATAPTPAQVEAFIQRAQAAAKSGQAERVVELFHFEGTPLEYQAQRRMYWEAYLKGGRFDNVTFVPMEQVEAEWTPRRRQMIFEPRTANGITESNNLDPVGAAVFRFKIPPNSANFRSLAVGMTPEGELKLAGTKLEGEPLIRADESAPSPFEPAAVTPEARDAFLDKVRRAHASGDWKEIAKLRDFRGATQTAVNRSVELIENISVPMELTDEELTFIPLAQINAEDYPGLAALAEGQTPVPGLELNLPLVGFVRIKQKTRAGSSITHPVGITEEGILKIPSPVPKPEG
ncbi:MAG: hypothetical protein AAGK14_01520 [Verrucomicrobiota bacterium]